MITIPRSQRPVVERLIKLPVAELDLLIGAIGQLTPTGSLGAMARHLGKRTQVASVRGILEMLGALGTIQEEQGIKSDELVDQLINAAQAEGITRDDSDWEMLKGRLTRLFDSSRSVIITAKATELVLENEHSYCPESRVVSDIRSVFFPGGVATPAGAVIVHMLKLAYHQGRDRREFFVALDTDDVRHLRDVLNRAIAKEHLLAEMVKPSGVPILTNEEELNG